MKRTLISFAAVLALSAGANAVHLKINSMVPDRAQVVTIQFNGTNKSVYAGAQSVSIDGASDVGLYCVDLGHANHFGDSYEATVDGLSTLDHGDLVGNLMTNFWGSIDSSEKAAAFQLALWDAVVDGGDGLDIGNFKGINLSSGLVSQYGLYQSSMNSAGPENLTISVYNAVNHGPNNKDHQNLIGAEAVPEPASMVALASAGALLIRRRRRG